MPYTPNVRREAPAEAISCEEFRARHADYMDGLLASAEESRWRAHATACLPCARHDRSIRRSCDLARALPPLEPSDDFYTRLQHRIFHLRDEERLTRSGSGGNVAVSVVIAGVIAAVAWSPALQPEPTPLELPAVEARAPMGGAYRVNLFATEAALPGIWLRGRPPAVGLLGPSPSFRAAVLVESEPYSGFRLMPSMMSTASALTSTSAASGAAVRD